MITVHYTACIKIINNQTPHISMLYSLFNKIATATYVVIVKIIIISEDFDLLLNKIFDLFFNL